MNQRLIAGSATVLLALFKTLAWVKRFLTAFFVLLYRPIRRILRFIFYTFVVRLYSSYLSALRKLGWSGRKRRGLAATDQRLTHGLVVCLAALLVALNITTRTNTVGAEETAGSTILSSLVESEFEEVETDQLIEEFFDEEAVISPAQQHYLDNLGVAQPQPQASRPAREEAEETAEIPVTQGGSALVKPEIASTIITKRPRPDIITYAVQPGDTVSTIAQEFEISVNTILWENDLSAYSLIRPGDKLTILPMTGLRHKIAKGETVASLAKKYSVAETEILAANKLADAGSLAVGQKILIPGGRKATVQYSQPTYSGLSALGSLLKPEQAKPVAGNKMNWPTVRKRITQYFSWRHHALDVADKVGTPIYAADAGTIESIGWGQGYGNQIVIDHGGGKKTRYAHLSKFYVKKGDTVSKGETVAAMGSTGWSTGPHLHFEVIINGVKYNPLSYVK